MERIIKPLFIFAILLIVGLFGFLGYVAWDLIATMDYNPNESIPQDVNHHSIISLSEYAEKMAHEWQDSIFLETYTVNYKIIEEEKELKLSPSGIVRFRFAGWRDDWLTGLAERIGFSHLIAHIEVNVDTQKIVRFSHSQGTGFGFDAPLDIKSWGISEKELFLICDERGGQAFRQEHNDNSLGVYATTTRVGRFWKATYGFDESTTFSCTVNIDNGEVSIRKNNEDWEIVETLNFN